MNLQETLQLLDKLRQVGALRFKSVGLEVDLCKDQPITIHMPPDAPAPTEPAQPSQQHSAENTKKVQDLIDLLKRKDEEILNQIFPEGA